MRRGKIDPDALLSARLSPDMFPFKRQVQIATDFAKAAPARLAGLTPPMLDDNEKTFADLKTRIAKTLDFMGGAKPEQIEARRSARSPSRPARAS